MGTARDRAPHRIHTHAVWLACSCHVSAPSLRLPSSRPHCCCDPLEHVGHKVVITTKTYIDVLNRGECAARSIPWGPSATGVIDGNQITPQ